MMSNAPLIHRSSVLLIQLETAWNIGRRIGSGGFGNVHEAISERGVRGAAKFVPKVPGAEREMLFVVELSGMPNVVPVLDSGETGDHWVIVMPLADMSLRQFLDQAAGPSPVAVSVAILTDLATALSALDGRVVHRDLKPENVLSLDGKWCLADFGISRYAEASTAPETRKHALSPRYSAPERWRGERAGSPTDVYSLGVIAYELVTGSRPFPGPATHDYREQHLHGDAPEVTGASPGLRALVAECLFKAPGARPAAASIVARLGRIERVAESAGLARLQEANLAEVARSGAAAARASEQATEDQRRNDLLRAAKQMLTPLGDRLGDAIMAAASAARVQVARGGQWTIRLGQASLALGQFEETPSRPWGGWPAPAFQVIASASLLLSVPSGPHGYTGRGHSLWFCDARETGRHAWFETAFMFSPFVRARSATNPFPLAPGIESAKALSNGLAEYDVAWPFAPLVADDLDAFIGRWAGWLAEAGRGALQHPPSMPEHQPEGSWRRV